MANVEYPDLPFVPPRAFGRGRDGYSVQYLVIHYTAGSERATSAEDGARYDQHRTDGVSSHYYVDRDSVVQCVYTWDRANTCFFYGNRLGIQYELCGTVQTRAQWLDAASDATLTRAARQAARDCIRYQLPVRKLTTAQMKAGWKGICGHHDVTLAYGLGDHTDPGREFPWDVFLNRVAQFVGAGGGGGGDDMDANQNQMLINIHEWMFVFLNGKVTGVWPHSDGALPKIVPNEQLQELVARPTVTLSPEQLDQLATAIADRLVDVVDSPLGEADKPAIRAAVADVLRGGVNSVDAAS